VNRTILLVGGLLTLSLLLLLGAGLMEPPRGPGAEPAQRPAPDFALPGVKGGTVSLAALRGKPAVVNLWATWCAGCVQEHETLQRAAKSLAGHVAFVGLSQDESPEVVRAFLEQRGSTYPVAVDTERRVASEFGTTGLPETFFLDASGAIRSVVRGPVSVQALAEHLDRLVAPPPTPGS